MSLGYGPNIVRDGLVLYLDAANPKSYPGTGTTWYDLSGNGHNGTLTNGSTYNSDNKGSIVFDGINDRIEIPSSTYTFNSACTFEMWFNLTAINRNQGFMSVNTGGYYINFWMPSDTNKLRWEVYQPAPNGTAFFSTVSFVTNKWYHVVGTISSGTMTLYINGLYDNSTTNNYPLRVVTAIAYVGDYGAGNYPSASKIAQVKIYNRALSAAEIAQNFAATRGRFGL